MRTQGKSLAEIGETFGVTHQAISLTLHKYYPEYDHAISYTRVILPCKTCGNEIVRLRNGVGDKNFCSYKCAGFSKRKNRTVEQKREIWRKRRKDYYKSDVGNKNIRDLLKKYASENKEKVSAWSKISYHLKNGNIVKPDNCEICKKPHQRIHAHHDNYKKPLDVKWVCPVCHKEIHRLLQHK